MISLIQRLKVQAMISEKNIIESFESEGILKGHLAQLPCSEQEHPQLNQGVRSLVHSGLESVYGQGIHHIYEQPVPVPHCPYGK